MTPDQRSMLRTFCETHGYGATMQAVSAMWREKDPVGALTVGPCYGGHGGRPILFSAPMVRAILAGKKTQTRRVIKPQPPDDCELSICGRYSPTKVGRDGVEYPGDEVYGASTKDGEWAIPCPFGGDGDRLWVRETHAMLPGATLAYKASWTGKEHENNNGPCWQWTPSIHMRREYSRLTLEVTGVRVERLQAISEGDAEAEGCRAEPVTGQRGDDGRYARDAFRDLWNSLNAKRGYGWEANPWAWVVEFRRVASVRPMSILNGPPFMEGLVPGPASD